MLGTIKEDKCGLQVINAMLAYDHTHIIVECVLEKLHTKVN